ncbi:MAG TPA: MXAN_2562 family outer membrane beta-barrel protein [Polyangiaceae bacterium]|nr:MXAN_2562 family outer membrane beta-barrel protein [Polyangiaceae bacterium]
MSAALARRCAGISTFAGLLSIGSLAHAQGVDEFGGYGTDRGERAQSKQEAAFELRIGRYVPEVDKGLTSTPFQDMFGTDSRFTFDAKVDWQVLRIKHLGSLGPGVGWCYTKFSAPARFEVGGGLSASTTRLNIMPMYAVAVLRADVFMRDFKVPLVPYAKLGLGYAMWWSSDGQRSAEYQGEKGKGGSYGLTYALGGMFLLDVLDQDDAKSADGLMGINNSYLFAEWFRPQLDGFGNNKILNLSSSSWVLGFALEI